MNEQYNPPSPPENNGEQNNTAKPPAQSDFPPQGYPSAYPYAQYPPYGAGNPNLFDDAIPYQGGIPVRCPRCGNVVNTRLCGFCGTDLAAFYQVNPSNPYQITATNQPMQGNIPYPGAGMAYPAGGIPVPPAGNKNVAYSPYGQLPVIPVNPMTGGGAYVKPKKRNTVLLVCGLCLLFIIIFAASSLLFRNMFSQQGDNPAKIPNVGGGQMPTSSEYYHPEGVTLEEYKQIEAGMSYGRVSNIIGGDGQIVSEGEDIQGNAYIIWGWYGEDNPNVQVYITFTDDKVSEISNVGLTDE